MKSKIYDYCNSLDAHAENYEDLPLTQAEHDRLKARVLGERTPRRHPSRWQKGLALAALVTLVAGLGAINGTTQ